MRADGLGTPHARSGNDFLPGLLALPTTDTRSKLEQGKLRAEVLERKRAKGILGARAWAGPNKTQSLKRALAPRKSTEENQAWTSDGNRRRVVLLACSCAGS
jgi:hypothetical protein